MQLRYLVLLAAVLAGCSREQEAPRALPGERESRVAAQDESELVAEPTIPDDAPTVAFLGDSISAGLHLDVSLSFPAVLQRALAKEGHPFKLVNAGVSGDTSAGGLRRIEWVLSSNPDIVVIELGGNDGLRGQDLKAIESNLRAIVAKAKAAGARVLLLGMLMPPSYGPEYANGFRELYERIASDEQLAFVPDFMGEVGGREKLMLEDGLHPSAEGHRKLAEKIEPELHGLLDGLVAR